MKHFIVIFLVFLCDTLSSQIPLLVKDIYSGNSNGLSISTSVIEYDGKGYFVADDGLHGYEVWITDGDSLGTTLLKDIYPGLYGPSGMYVGPYDFNLYNGKLYFIANDSIHGYEIWVTDGATGGTTMLTDICSGPENSLPNIFATYNGKLIFSANCSSFGSGLWMTDGTDSGTILIKQVSVIENGLSVNACAYSNKLYFQGYDTIHGGELWVTDGTDSGTHIVKDILPGTGWGLPQNTDLINYNNKLYFLSWDSTHNWQIWTTDGSDTGTILFRDNSLIFDHRSGFIVYNGKMYFEERDSLYNVKIWETDGTDSGTSLIKICIPDSIRGFTTHLIHHEGQLYFRVAGELWITDGTASGTHSVNTSAKQIGIQMISYNSKLFYIANNHLNGHGWQLYQYDNVNNTETEVSHPPSSCMGYVCCGGEYPSELSVAIGSLFYPAHFNGSSGIELNKLDTNVLISVIEVKSTTGCSLTPNPTCSELKIDIGGATMDAIRIYNTTGQLILETKQPVNNSIDVSYLSNGMYLVQITTGREPNRVTRRFVKM